jgi:hypothetical protein
LSAEEARGATPQDWFNFDFVLGLGAHLLPCVPFAPDVKVVKGSALENKVGKIPSMFNRAGEAHGITEWQKRPILGNEVQLWSTDPRLNLCVRTGGMSHVYAFDIDIDGDQAGAVRQLVTELAGVELPARSRPNSKKVLLAFRMEATCKKRKIKLDDQPRGPAIELLADGQQFVAAGSHSSGARYQWLPALPSQIPELTMETVDRIWTRLIQTYAPTSGATSLSTTSASVTASGLDLTTEMTETTLSVISDSEWGELIKALRFMLDKVADNDSWSQIGYALLSLQYTREARDLWLDFSRKAVGYVEGAPEAWWHTHANQTPRSDYRHIFTLARGLGWGATSAPNVFGPIASSGGAVQTTDNGPDGSDSSTSAGQTLDVAPAPLPDKRLVRLVADNFAEIVHQLENIIAPEVYTQGPYMSRITQAHEDRSIQRESDAVMIVEATLEWAKTRLSELCTFQRYSPKKGEWYNVGPSNEHINAVLGLRAWTRIRPLDAVARSPFVRPDGSICTEPGYDPTSRSLLFPNTGYPEIPANPSRSDALSALQRIRGIFDQFPWKTRAAESAFLSHILTEAARLACDCVPMFWYTAPKAGHGKGYLQQMASVIVHGNNPSLRPWVGESEELRKTLYAALLAGDRSLLFDNVPSGNKIRAAALCAFITAEYYTDRKLGVSEGPKLTNRAVLSASGNNITPVGDMARRSVVIRLDANMEKLDQREFKIRDIRGYVRAHRAELLIDILTIIKAYHAAPMEDAPIPLPTFVSWSHFCRDPLIWLGLPDPVETQEEETDDEQTSRTSVFTALAERMAGAEFTCVDLARIPGSITDSDGVLANALMEAGCPEPNNPKKVGYWLRDERDKVVNGWKLVHLGHSMAGAKWRFERVTQELT